MAKQFREARALAGLPEEFGLVLWAARLWHAGSEENRQPGCRHEDDKTQGYEDRDAAPASRAGDRRAALNQAETERETRG